MSSVNPRRVLHGVDRVVRGVLWCTSCKATRRFAPDDFSGGFPECCGATMTVDSPAERRAAGKGPRPRRPSLGQSAALEEATGLAYAALRHASAVNQRYSVSHGAPGAAIKLRVGRWWFDVTVSPEDR